MSLFLMEQLKEFRLRIDWHLLFNIILKVHQVPMTVVIYLNNSMT